MKSKFVLVILFLLSAGSARGSEFSAVEGEFLDCIESNKDQSCLENFFRGHFRGNKGLSKQLQDMISAYYEWTEGRKPHQVFTVDSKDIGGYASNKLYMIEKDDGDLLLFRVYYINSLSRWQVYSVNLTSNPNEFIKIFGVSLM